MQAKDATEYAARRERDIAVARWEIAAMCSIALVSACGGRAVASGRFTLASSAGCSNACIEQALVALSGSDAAGLMCLGTVIGSNEQEALVLTAAHCVQSASGSGALFVQPAVGHSGRARRLRTWVHPRFVPTVTTSNYDAALLEAPRMPRASVAPLLGSDGLRAGVAVSVVSAALPGVEHANAEQAFVTGVRPLSLSLAQTGNHACHGASGAPVVIEREGGSFVAGVVSHGPRDCAGDAVATRVSAIEDGFITAIAAGSKIGLTPQRCAECIEDAEDTRDACVSALSRCHADDVCADMLECLGGPTESKESCVRASSANDLVRAVVRCACVSGCHRSCATVCEWEAKVESASGAWSTSW